MRTNGSGGQIFFHVAARVSYTLSSSGELYIDEVGGELHIRVEKNKTTAHIEYSKNIMSRAINEESEKFVLTSNQTKDQRGLGKICRRKTVSLPTSLLFCICKNMHSAPAERWKEEIKMEISVIGLAFPASFLLPKLVYEGMFQTFNSTTGRGEKKTHTLTTSSAGLFEDWEFA